MKNRYFIEFTNKRQIRLLIRFNQITEFKLSSIYRFSNNYYICLDTDKDLQLGQINITILQQHVLTSIKRYIYEWACYEITQDFRYIKYETDSYLDNGARTINIGSHRISRMFDKLIDVFAIVNYTTDSFSDGGKYNQLDLMLDRINYHLSNQAQIIDLGLESTRPGAVGISHSDEIELLKIILPEVLALKSTQKFRLSIDSYHPQTVRWLLDYDVDIINDVSGNLPHELVRKIFLDNKQYVAMHSLSIPANKSILIDIDTNPVEFILAWMKEKMVSLGELIGNVDNLILDVGIGFGKNQAQSKFIIDNLDLFSQIGCEILLGHSRKSFFSHINNIASSDLDLESAYIGTKVVNLVDYLRLHDLNQFNRLIKLT